MDFLKFERGWYTYTTNGIEFVPLKNEASLDKACKTCQSNNFNSSIICLDCRRSCR